MVVGGFGHTSNLVRFLFMVPGEQNSRIPPIQLQLPELRPQLGQVPHLDTLVIHTHGQMATIRTESERHDIRLPLIGDFNISNALGAAAAAWAVGVAAATIAERLATIPQVPGRLACLR